LYCTLALLSPEGELLNLHRKLKPTASERLIWGEGDGSGLRVQPTDIGKIGGLICWENYMPLARTALYQGGVEIYLAPTADARESWQSTIRHIALEGRCYVLSCNQFVTKADYPSDLGKTAQAELTAAPDPLCRGGSAIIGPMGEYIAGPLWDEAGILYATLDLGALTEARFDFDVVGHYTRPDLLTLSLSPQVGIGNPATAGLDYLLSDLLLGGPAAPFFPGPGIDFDDSEPFADIDPFMQAIPAAWSEKKGPARTPPKAPRKQTRKRR
jgi:nitrilase